MFQLTKEGPIWSDTTPESKSAFLNAILNQETKVKSIYDLPTPVQQQLENLTSMVLGAAYSLKRSNLIHTKSLENILQKGNLKADLILPVHGGLHVVKPCIESVLKRTNWPFRLIIVDDASPDGKTKQWLKKWARENPEHEVYFNLKNKGFAATINKGIKLGSSPYVCILNSDTLVTDNWLTKMIFALESDSKISIVNPITNATAVTAIPLKEGLSYIDMNKGFEAVSAKQYPEIVPNGYCYLFRRSLINEMGYFDEGYESYGEETDWWMRSVCLTSRGEYKRYRAVLAEDTYIYHERGSSFSILGQQKHSKLRAESNQRFHTTWPQYRSWKAAHPIERDIEFLKQNLPDNSIDFNYKYNFAFLTFSTSYCGGMKFLTDIINKMNENNINAKIVKIPRQKINDETTLNELRCGPIQLSDMGNLVKEFKEKVFDEGIVCAATAEAVPIVNLLCDLNIKLKPLLLAQSFDPALSYNEETANLMKENYKKAATIISTSSWVKDAITQEGGNVLSEVIWPGVDKDLFYTRDRLSGDERPTVMFILNNKYPYKGFERGVQVAYELEKLALADGTDIRILAYGIDVIRGGQFITTLGNLSQTKLAHILGTEVDVFCDPSHVHSYGMPALEASVSGCVPVCWKESKGIEEYATNGIDALIIKEDSTNQSAAKAIYLLLKDKDKLQKMKKKAVTKPEHNRQLNVVKFIDLIEKNFKLSSKSRRISIITPHLRKHGGPTTIANMANELQKRGHHVTLTTIYADLNPEVIQAVNVPIRVDWKNIKPCDILISNSDNPYNEFLIQNTPTKKKICLKLSHNPRFQEHEDNTLKLPWDKIITSTKWLKEACENPDIENKWTHPPVDATRVGWYHYSHHIFAADPEQRQYKSANGNLPIIGTLIHHHPLKGTSLALKALETIKQKYNIPIIGIGEVKDFKKPDWMDQYFFSISRAQLAEIFKSIDIWVSASLTEGLGRMMLEAMSGGTGCVMTDTNCEFAIPNENCLVVPKEDTGRLVQAIELLLKDNNLFMNIVKSGFKTASQFADPHTYITNIEAVIQELFND